MAYSQNDTRWKKAILGFGGADSTIGGYGCFVTAFANVCAWAGRDITPLQLNEEMKRRKWFTTDLVNNHKVPSDLYPDVLEWVEERHWTGPTDMNYFADASDPNVAYIIKIDAAPAKAGLQTHFIMVWAKKGNDLIIEDSWDGQRKSLANSYGSPTRVIYSAFKYRKKAAKATNNQGDEDMAKPTPEEVSQAYQNIAGRDPSQQELDYHIAKSTYKSLIQGFFNNKDTAVARANNLRGQLDAAGNVIRELEKRPTHQQLDEAVAQAATLAVEEYVKNSAVAPQVAQTAQFDLKAVWRDFLVRISSRKFIAAVVSAGVAIGNFLFGWGLDPNEVLTAISPLLIFIGIEGWKDAKAVQQ